MKSDIEIAQEAALLPITELAARAGIHEDELECYGRYKAKISDSFEKRAANIPDGKLILVTAVNPTPAGEGKTTVTVGLGMALNRLGHKCAVALREPSLGPVFGIKGGAAGGGYSQVVPMEDINLHFTGDIHAVTAANNLICAALDNHIEQGNELGIDPRRVVFHRVMDMNDRALRKIVIGLGGPSNGVPREESFMISAASEVMAILCLASSVSDLKERLCDILLAYTFDGKPVFCRDIGISGAAAALLRDAIKPNLVQTLDGTPAIIHGGPFANIAHGCNSVRATKTALKLGDYAVTEAGFGADLGAEKFFDIKCRVSGLRPSCVVLVATVRALKYNGGVKKDSLSRIDLAALEKGTANLAAHIENIRKFGMPVVFAINRFESDTEAELALIEKAASECRADFAVADVFEKGAAGGLELAEKVVAACEKHAEKDFRCLYDLNEPIKAKLEKVAKEIYGAGSVEYEPAAEKAIQAIGALGEKYARLPVCIAKTQYSFSDDPKLLGRPTGFKLTVRDVRLSSGAGFIVAETGSIMTMPGLPKIPAAESIDVDPAGNITGLF